LWAGSLEVVTQDRGTAGVAERSNLCSITVPVTVASFSNHSAMVVLKESSLLVRGRCAGPCAGASRYFRMVCQPMLRWRSILRMGQRSDTVGFALLDQNLRFVRINAALKVIDGHLASPCYRCKGIRNDPHTIAPCRQALARARAASHGRKATRSEQRARYVDCGPQNWDDRQ
jgi:hypothetical protein